MYGLLRCFMIGFLAMAAFDAVYAQTTNARLVGTVRDRSGAVIPGVTVEVKNLGTNRAQSVLTGDTGDFVVPNLPIGIYSVSASIKGFKRSTQPKLELAIDQTARVDFVLETGDITESVTVEGGRPLVDTEQSSIGKVVDNNVIVQLPLTARNFISLGSLIPGTTAGAPGNSVVRDRQEGVALTANGQRAESNNFMLDGADNSAGFVGVVVVVPSMDAIQEFKVQTANYSAEYGRSAGAIVNVAIKSGSNQFHGAAYEFVRNNVFDSRGFFAPQRNPLRRNNFGGSLGGRVIPDKTFFFVNYEGLTERRVSTGGYLVPTAAMRAGDFTGLAQIFDPLALDAAGDRVAFAGNRIPANRINPIAAKLLPIWPDPNNLGDPARNYLQNLNNPLDRHQFHVRGDQYLTSKDQLMARISWTQTDDVNKSIALNGQTTQNKHRSGIAGWTRTLSPTVLNDFRVSATDYNFNLIPDGQGTDYATPLGLPSFASDPSILRHPSIGVSSIAGVGGADSIPLLRREVFYQFLEAMTVVRGRQTIKFGGDLRMYRSNNFQPQTAMGNYSFTGAFTAQRGRTYTNGFGDLLLGLPLSQRILIPVSYDATRLNNNRLSLYLQDDWQVHPKLTLNLGVRWEREGDWSEARNRWAYLDFQTGEVVYPKALQIPFKLPYAYRSEDITSLKPPTDRSIAPRIGFAWRPFGGAKTVVRSAYGIFWGQPQGFVLLNSASTPPPFYLRSEFTSSATTPELRFGVFPGVSADNFVPASPTFFTHDPRNFSNGYVQQWNIGIDRQLTSDTAVSVSYVGNKSTHLERRQQGNAALPPGAGNLNARRRFPKLGSITQQESSSYSTYHSLQMSAERKLSKGLLFLGAFTWAKSLDDTSTWSGLGGQESQFAQDPSRLFLEKGRSGFDLRRRVTLSYVYELPFRFSSKAIGAVLGGWQTSGIVTLQSGFPLSATMPGDVPNAGTGNTRPNLNGPANLQPSERNIDRWFNTAAFTATTPFTFGTAGRNIIDGPGTRGFTTALMKVFSLTERNKLQFRGEFSNAFNHPNFGLPNVGFGSVAFGTIRGGGGGRETQLGLKYIF